MLVPLTPSQTCSHHLLLSYIHLTGNFLYWHRMFIWTFEQTLRNECGYQGYLPYWNYAKTSEDLLNSPMYVRTRLDEVGPSSDEFYSFDGSDTSISGNGNFVAHNATKGLPSGLLDIQPGTGGMSLLSYPPTHSTQMPISHPHPFARWHTELM